MKKIVVLARNSIAHPEYGGMETSMWNLCTELKKIGHKLEIITTSGAHEKLLLEIFDKVTCIPKTRPGKYSAIWWYRSFIMGFKYSCSSKFDVLSISLAGSLFTFTSKRKNVYSVSQCHGTAYGEAISCLKTPTLNNFIKAGLHFLRVPRDFLFYKVFDVVAAVSPRVANELNKYPIHLENKKIVVVPNGVSEKVYSFDSARRSEIRQLLDIPDESIAGIYVGRTESQKGVDISLHALALGDKNKHLIVIGSGPQLQELQQVAINLGVQERAHFLGQRVSSEISGFMSAADVGLFTTRRVEGFPMVNLELLANGLPVICTPNAIPPEGASGVFICYDDPAEISKIWDNINSNSLLDERSVSKLPTSLLISQIAEKYRDLYAQNKH